MVSIWISSIIRNIVIVLLFLPAAGMAADFELFWDPNCSSDPTLEGYYIYYKEDASVVDNSDGAFELFVGLSDTDFDPDEPGYLVADLLDDMRYCFTVTAWYGDEESDMSNEVCGINGEYYWEPATNPAISANPSTDNASTINSSRGCFISTLK